MKTTFFWLTLCLAFAYTRSASSQVSEPVGIKFYTGTWNDVLAEAKRQNKTVFVDIYTNWCVPCKLMAKQAFPDGKVSGMFNGNFINYQLNAEKGEGKKVAEKYAVNAYPTSLYVSAEGDLIHRMVGYNGIDIMLEEAEKAATLAKSAVALSTMERQYKEGRRDSSFLDAYLTKCSLVNKPNGEALEDYLQLLPEANWPLQKNLELIIHNVTSVYSKAYHFLLRQVPLLIKSEDGRLQNLGQEARMQQFTVINKAFAEAVNTQNESLLEECIQYELKVYSTMLNNKIKAEEFIRQQKLRFYQQTKNMNKYRPLALVEASRLMNISIDSIRLKDEVEYKRFQEQTLTLPDSVKHQIEFRRRADYVRRARANEIAMKFNDLAWAYYENAFDNKDLNQALIWSLKSLDYSRTGDNLNTYAHLLSKLGHKNDAVKVQKEAISLVKIWGNDTEKYEKALTKLK